MDKTKLLGGGNMDFKERYSDKDINNLIFERWSPRAFSGKPIDEQKLMNILEAARWAPSCFNDQPWRFIVAAAEKDRAVVIEALADTNKLWAKNAPVLVAVASRTSFSHNDKPNRWNGFDAGCAWGYLALEARRQGLYAHAMGGFDKLKLKELLELPDEYELYAVVAIGELASIDVLSEELRGREKPSERKPLENIVHFGKYQVK